MEKSEYKTPDTGIEIYDDRAVFSVGMYSVTTGRYTTTPEGKLAETSLYHWLRAIAANEPIIANGTELPRETAVFITESVLTRPIHAFADIYTAGKEAEQALEELARKAEEMTDAAVTELLAEGARRDTENLMEIAEIENININENGEEIRIQEKNEE